MKQDTNTLYGLYKYEILKDLRKNDTCFLSSNRLLIDALNESKFNAVGVPDSEEDISTLIDLISDSKVRKYIAIELNDYITQSLMINLGKDIVLRGVELENDNNEDYTSYLDYYKEDKRNL